MIPLSFVKPRWKFPAERYRFIFYPSFSEKLFYKGRKGEYKGKEIGANLNPERGFSNGTDKSGDVKVTNRKIPDER